MRSHRTYVGFVAGFLCTSIAYGQSAGPTSTTDLPPTLTEYQHQVADIPALVMVGKASLGAYDGARSVPIKITVQTTGAVLIEFDGAPEWNESFPARPESEDCGMNIGRARGQQDTTYGCRQAGPWFYPFHAVAKLEGAKWAAAQDAQNTAPNALRVYRSDRTSADALKQETQSVLTFDDSHRLSTLTYSIELPGAQLWGSRSLDVQTSYSDYRSVGAFELPFRITESLGQTVHCNIVLQSVTISQ